MNAPPPLDDLLPLSKELRWVVSKLENACRGHEPHIVAPALANVMAQVLGCGCDDQRAIDKTLSDLTQIILNEAQIHFLALQAHRNVCRDCSGGHGHGSHHLKDN